VDAIIRLDQQTGAMEQFVLTTDRLTGRPIMLSTDEFHARREHEAAITAQLDAERRVAIAPCLKTGKSQLDCEWDLLLKKESSHAR